MERVNSRVVYQNPWMVVREDEIRHPDGTAGIFGVVEKPDFALVMPRWRDGFWLVEQFRRAFTDQEIAGMIRSEQIVDAPSLAALTLFQLQLSSDNPQC
ncbi:hypothetical protein ACFPIJ_34700 [Dactylosporangium cerinum]|uniref:Cytochrome P450 n=1 Tax=Dactylosporangium cerinum TaxID=1434730 RepID=A0ABV9W311_9ACTN